MQYIIDFIDTASDELIQQYLQENDCLIIRSFDTLKKVYFVESINAPQQTDIVQSIINDSENPITLLSYPIAEGELYPIVDFETDAVEDWWKVASAHNPDLDAASQIVFRRGANATVYIVDSGIKADHPEFEFADVSTLYSFNGDMSDYNGHGTAIASLIAGKTCALSAAKVKALKVFQSGTTTLQSHLLAAFDAIINDVVANPTSFPIVNLSWSIPKNVYIESKIREMISHGISVIVAAGNSGLPIDDVTPASMPEVCTVGSYTQDFEPADFSNYTGEISNTGAPVNGGALDVWAPGVNIRVAKLDGTLGWANGTSMSTAIHAAALAYNSHRFVLADGTMPDTIKVDTYHVAIGSSGKDGLLTLNDQYVTSINKVTKYGTILDGQNNTSINSGRFIGIHTTSGKKLEKMMPGKLITDNFVIHNPLPPGFYLDGDWLIGTMEVTEPYVFTSPLSYTTFGGRQIDGSITIVVMPENMTAQDANLDPEVEMILLAADCNATLFGGGPSYYCAGNCAINGGICENACGPAGQKDPDPGALYCYCTGSGFNDCP